MFASMGYGVSILRLQGGMLLRGEGYGVEVEGREHLGAGGC